MLWLDSDAETTSSLCCHAPIGWIADNLLKTVEDGESKCLQVCHCRTILDLGLLARGLLIGVSVQVTYIIYQDSLDSLLFQLSSSEQHQALEEGRSISGIFAECHT